MNIKNGLIAVFVAVFVLSCTISVACEDNRFDAAAIKLPSEISHITFLSRKSESCDNLVVIEHAKNSGEGLAAEKHWIKKNYPSARIVTKALSREKGRIYEIVKIRIDNERTETLCFDVTGFFGVW